MRQLSGVRYWFARALLDRNGPGDRDRALQMLTEARTLSESMGLHGQTRWIDTQLARCEISQEK